MIEDGIAMGRQPESRALTGLRGIGALLVLMHHFYLHFGLQSNLSMVASLLRKGYLGVDLFFVLSGFVIAMVYGGWFQAPGRNGGTALFLLRRAARLWPLHLVVVAATVVVFTAREMPFHPLTVVANVSMVQAWGISAEINPPAWSVSTEWFAYVLFPFLAPVLLKSRAGLLLGIVGVVGLIAVDIILAPPLGPGRRGFMDIYFNYSVLPVLRCLAGFILGITAWRLGEAASVREAFRNAWVGPGALGLMLVLMVGRVNDLLIYPLLPVIVLGFHFGTGPVWRSFATGPIYRLGVLSYAFYLMHYQLLLVFPFDWVPRPLGLTAYFGATLGVAALLHHGIEWPARLLVRRWGEAALARLLHRPLPRLPLQGGPG